MLGGVGRAVSNDRPYPISAIDPPIEKRHLARLAPADCPKQSADSHNKCLTNQTLTTQVPSTPASDYRQWQNQIQKKKRAKDNLPNPVSGNLDARLKPIR